VGERTSYDVGDGLTAIAEDLAPSLSGLPSTPIEVCAIAQGLIVLPDLAVGFGIPEARQGERNIRAATDIIRALLALDSAPIHQNRALSDRIVGTCRHFSVVSCALLRYRGIPARSRCGFAAYFVPGGFVDHWIVEYWNPGDQRWVRVDSEILGFELVDTPQDLAPGEFLSGGEAWSLCRQGLADPSRFGVDGYPKAWGIGEVRGNAIRDLAALNKTEMLPWDEWGRMKDSYNGATGPDYDELMDTIAATCASDDAAAIEALYDSEDLAVPPSMAV
jgi:hypothetical protein